MSLVDAASSGSRLDTLRSLRDVLAEQIVTAEQARDVAALSRQLTLVLAEIDELAPPVAKEGTPLDELKRRRAERGKAPGSRRAGKSAV